jgi:hypothetical protein
MMEVFHQPGRHGILFHVRAKTDNVLDELAFICLLEMKFDGEIGSAHRFSSYVNTKKRLFLSIDLTFPDYDLFDGAKYHCDRNLTDDWAIRADYQGALDAADPGRVMASQLYERARKTPNSN